jgi:hypothetical protein
MIRWRLGMCWLALLGWAVHGPERPLRAEPAPSDGNGHCSWVGSPLECRAPGGGDVRSAAADQAFPPAVDFDTFAASPPIRLGALDLVFQQYPQPLTSVIAPDRGFAFVGTDPYRRTQTPGEANIIKVALGSGDQAPTLVARLPLGSDEFFRPFECPSVVDEQNGYAYFATSTLPVKIVKVALGSGNGAPSRVGHLTLQPGDGTLSSAVVDGARGYAYFGTNTTPGRVIKVALGADSSPPSRVADLTLGSDVGPLSSAVIDPERGYAYFGTNTMPGKVVKVALGAGNAPPTRVAELTLNSDEGPLHCAALDAPPGYAFFGSSGNQKKLVKVFIGAGSSAPNRIGSALIPNASRVSSLVLDPSKGHAYVGVDGAGGGPSSGRLTKWALGVGSAPPSFLSFLEMDFEFLTPNTGNGEAFLWNALIDPARGHAFLGTSDITSFPVPYRIVKVSLNPPERVVDIVGNGQLILPHDRTPKISDGTAFPPRALGSEPIESTFTLTNNTSAPQILTGVLSEGPHASDFSVTTLSSGEMAPGSSRSFRVRFAPTALGLRSATIAVVMNAQAPNFRHEFTVSGVGVNQESFVPLGINAYPDALGWEPLGQSGPLFTPGIGGRAHDTTNTALSAMVGASRQGRIIGWLEDSATDLPYASVGLNHFVRAKFALFYQGAGDSGSLALANLVPNFRLSLRTRGIVTSHLEINHNSQTGGVPEQLDVTRELGPSTQPDLPSVYRVDLDPVDTPYLTGSGEEGIRRGFETLVAGADYSFVRGTLALTESSIGIYPALSGSVAPAKVFAAEANDFQSSGVILSRLGLGASEIYRYLAGPNPADYFNPDVLNLTVNEEQGLSISSSGAGITVNSVGLPSGRIGVADAAFVEGNATDSQATRLRAEADRLYLVSFRLKHPAASDTTPFTRFNARTAGFGYNATFELLGGRGLSAPDARAGLAQVLPGVGNQVPGSSADGTLYHLLLSTPLSPEIRADVAGTLAEKFPRLTSEPPPGDPAPSLRDINFGFTVVDSMSLTSPTSTDPAEAATDLTLNRIEIRSYPQVVD